MHSFVKAYSTAAVEYQKRKCRTCSSRDFECLSESQPIHSFAKAKCTFHDSFREVWFIHPVLRPVKQAYLFMMWDTPSTKLLIKAHYDSVSLCGTLGKLSHTVRKLFSEDVRYFMEKSNVARPSFPSSNVAMLGQIDC